MLPPGSGLPWISWHPLLVLGGPQAWALCPCCPLDGAQEKQPWTKESTTVISIIQQPACVSLSRILQVLSLWVQTGKLQMGRARLWAAVSHSKRKESPTGSRVYPFYRARTEAEALVPLSLNVSNRSEIFPPTPGEQ